MSYPGSVIFPIFYFYIRVVLFCLMFVLLVVLVLFLMNVSIFSYVLIPELQPICKRAADSVLTSVSFVY